MEHVNKAMEAVKPYHAKLTNYLNTSQDPFCQFLAKAETATGACVSVVRTRVCSLWQKQTRTGHRRRHHPVLRQRPVLCA